jgi:hypothetical protein
MALNIQNCISRQIQAEPFALSETTVAQVYTDIDELPYPRFFRGRALAAVPVLFDREAGVQRLRPVDEDGAQRLRPVGEDGTDPRAGQKSASAGDACHWLEECYPPTPLGFQTACSMHMPCGKTGKYVYTSI